MEGFEELQLGVWTLHTSRLGENSLEAEADVVVPSCLRTCQRPRVTSHERKKLENEIRVARHSLAPQVSLQIGRNIDFSIVRTSAAGVFQALRPGAMLFSSRCEGNRSTGSHRNVLR